jgi:hypothetical protein
MYDFCVMQSVLPLPPEHPFPIHRNPKCAACPRAAWIVARYEFAGDFHVVELQNDNFAISTV